MTPTRREPEPDLDFIFLTHGHEDHLGRMAEIPKGAMLASLDVCQVGRAQGVPCSRLWAIEPGDEVEHVLVLKGCSTVGWLAAAFIVSLALLMPSFLSGRQGWIFWLIALGFCSGQRPGTMVAPLHLAFRTAVGTG